MYAIFEDFTRCYVGPFNSQEEIDAHVEFCKERGDGGSFLGIVHSVPEGEFTLTPEEDRECMDEIEEVNCPGVTIE